MQLTCKISCKKRLSMKFCVLKGVFSDPEIQYFFRDSSIDVDNLYANDKHFLSFPRAQVGIPEGAEITTQYLTPLIGTMQRRKKIRCDGANKFFSSSYILINPDSARLKNLFYLNSIKYNLRWGPGGMRAVGVGPSTKNICNYIKIYKFVNI